MDKKVADLLDRDEIRRLQERYFRGTDRHDLELMKDCFWPEAEAEYGLWRGLAIELPAFSSPMLKSLYVNTTHLMAQCQADITGDIASSETYCMACHHLADQGSQATVDIMWCRYIDRLEKREGEWRIAHRLFVVDQIQRLIAPDRGPLDFSIYAHGYQGRDDPSYR
jgi:hypothetical protein